MTPAAFWILVAFILLLMGTVIVYWATTRHDGIEPDSGPPFRVPPPTPLEIAVMENSRLTYTKWLAMSPAEQSVHVERYFTHKGL